MNLRPIILGINCPLGDWCHYPSSVPRVAKRSLNSQLAFQDGSGSLFRITYARVRNGELAGSLLGDCADCERNYALQAEDFDVKHRRDRQCCKIMQGLAECMQSVNRDMAGPIAPICFREFTLYSFQRTMRVRRKIKSNVRVARRIFKALNLAGFIRMQKLRFCCIPRANYRPDGSECLNPVSPFRFVEIEIQARSNQCTKARYGEQRVSNDSRFQIIRINCHMGILS